MGVDGVGLRAASCEEGLDGRDVWCMERGVRLFGQGRVVEKGVAPQAQCGLCPSPRRSGRCAAHPGRSHGPMLRVHPVCRTAISTSPQGDRRGASTARCGRACVRVSTPRHTDAFTSRAATCSNAIPTCQPKPPLGAVTPLVRG